MVFAFVPSALAANTPQASAAEKLYTLGMLAGTGTNPDGSVNFELGASINRAQAVTLIINLLGKYDEATSQTWETPFTDVPGWALPFVGYAYANKITSGTSETTFGSANPVLPKQYLTFVLNALGYEPGVDFTYDKAWEKSDALGFTNGRINAQTTQFLRGDAISVTYDSLSAVDKATGKPLFEKLIASGIFTKDLADKVGLGIAPPPVTESKVVADIKAGQKLVEFGDYTWRVLSIEGDKALLITDLVIDVRTYNDELVEITWENSSLRKYLNGEFYDAFSSTEKSRILTTSLNNSNSIEGTLPGNFDTSDKVFLLSPYEMDSYFAPDFSDLDLETPEAFFTAQAFEKLNNLENRSWNVDEPAWWWLRQPGSSSLISFSDSWVWYENDSFFLRMDDPSIGVRPTLYIDLK
jgi:hypothetical protein